MKHPKKISVIFASPSRYNAGMHFVDLAFDMFILSLNVNFIIHKYRFVNISYNRDYNNRYKDIIESYNELIDSDIIIYWGDFLHMFRYQERTARKFLDNNIATSFHDGLDISFKYLLHANCNTDIIAKTVSFGDTLILDSTIDTISKPYFDYLSRFAANCKLYMPRDTYSYNLLSHFSKNNIKQGVDCALLYWAYKRSKSDFNINYNNSKIGVFFGRSSKNLAKLGYFSKRLGNILHLDIEWIKWLKPKSRFETFKHSLSKLFIPFSSIRDYYCHSNFDSLNEYSLIITDTYHLAVNAWAAGIPAICIAEITKFDRNENVSSGARYSWRDKRYSFYQTIDALDFFVYNYELSNIFAFKRRLNHILDCLNDPILLNWIFSRIKRSVNFSTDELIKCIIE